MFRATIAGMGALMLAFGVPLDHGITTEDDWETPVTITEASDRGIQPPRAGIVSPRDAATGLPGG